MNTKTQAAIAVLLLFLFSTTSYADGDWFVRPNGGVYGMEDGTSYDDAWDGFGKIDWNAMGSEDTLYLVGSFDEGHLNVRTGGDASNDFFIRGDHTLGSGIINNGGVRWIDSSNSYITVDGLLIINGGIRYSWPTSKYEANNIELVSPDKLRDHTPSIDGGPQLISRGFMPGMMILLSRGVTSNRKSYLITDVTDQGAYEEITIDTSPDASFAFGNEGNGTPVAKGIESFWPNHHITVQNCTISSPARELVQFTGTDFVVKDNELDGLDGNSHGALYIFNRFFWRQHKNITISGNYIHNVGNALATRDSHCIGVQGVDGLVITKNLLRVCGAGIVVWNSSSSKNIGTWEITYNRIEKMDFNRRPAQWGGSGIIFTNGGVSLPGIIAHNLVVDPQNCPGDPENFVACRGIRYNRPALGKIHNNVIEGYDWGIELRNNNVGPYSVDVRNNVVINSSLGHIRAETSFTSHTEDYNDYYPDTGTLFRLGNTYYNFSDYSAAHSSIGSTVNQNSITTDPGLDSNYMPVGPIAPVVGAGVDMGRDYFLTVTWPVAAGGGNFILAADTISPDIGAFTYPDTDGDSAADDGDSASDDGDSASDDGDSASDDGDSASDDGRQLHHGEPPGSAGH